MPKSQLCPAGRAEGTGRCHLVRDWFSGGGGTGLFGVLHCVFFFPFVFNYIDGMQSTRAHCSARVSSLLWHKLCPSVQPPQVMQRSPPSSQTCCISSCRDADMGETPRFAQLAPPRHSAATYSSVFQCFSPRSLPLVPGRTLCISPAASPHVLQSLAMKCPAPKPPVQSGSWSCFHGACLQPPSCN